MQTNIEEIVCIIKSKPPSFDIFSNDPQRIQKPKFDEVSLLVEKDFVKKPCCGNHNFKIVRARIGV